MVSEITRSSVIDFLLMRNTPFYGKMDLLSFLKRVWDLSSMPSTDSRYKDAEGDIWKHMVMNDDWDDHYLLTQILDLLYSDDRTFCLFLENCVHPLVVKDEKERIDLVRSLNKYLLEDGIYLANAGNISGKKIYKMKEAKTNTEAILGKAYEVALSFAGEDRDYVETVAEMLKEHDVNVFYDRYEEIELWGKDLVEHLDKIYKSARYCVMFISRSYAEKVWTNHERKSAIARSIEEKTEYILPARFDDTEIPGVRKTLGYVDLRKKSPEEFALMIIEKLGRC